MNAETDQLTELCAKEILTNEEWKELISLSPPGTFWSLGNLQTIGPVNILRAFQNLTEGAERTKHALRNKCFSARD